MRPPALRSLVLLPLLIGACAVNVNGPVTGVNGPVNANANANVNANINVTPSPVPTTSASPTPTPSPSPTASTSASASVPASFHFEAVTTPLGAPTAWDALSGSDVWVVKGAKIAYSSDGGANWITTTTSATNLTAITMLDRNTGWAVGNGCLLKMTGGPSNWIVVNPMLDSGGAFTYGGYDVAFSDPQHGYILANSWLFKTADGGNTWEFVMEGSTPAYVGEPGLTLGKAEQQQDPSYYPDLTVDGAGRFWVLDRWENNTSENGLRVSVKSASVIRDGSLITMASVARWTMAGMGLFIMGPAYLSYSNGTAFVDYPTTYVTQSRSLTSVQPLAAWADAPNLRVIAKAGNQTLALTSSDAGASWLETNHNAIVPEITRFYAPDQAWGSIGWELYRYAE